MKKQLLLLLLLLPVITFGQLTQANVQDTINLYIKSPLGVTPVKKTFTTLNQFAGQSSVTANSVTTFTNKSISGLTNTFSNIPYSALTGTPTIPSNYITTNSNQTGLTGDKTSNGTWTLNGTFANKQLILGSNTQAANLSFIGGTGLEGMRIGYQSATATVPIIYGGTSSGLSLFVDNATAALALAANGASGNITLSTNANRALTVFQTGDVRISTTTSDDGNKLRVDGTSYFNGNGTIAGNFAPEANITRNLGSAANNFASVNTINIASNAGLGIDKAVTNSLQFRNGTTSSVFGGSFATTGNWFFQAPGTFPTDLGYRAYFDGTTYHNGVATFAGNVLPEANSTRNLGSASFQWATVNTPQLSSANAILLDKNVSNGFYVRNGNSSSNILFALQPTTGNAIFQAAGVMPTDLGYRLYVDGTTYHKGNATFEGNILPEANNTRELGSTSLRYANVFSANFLSGGTAQFGTTSNSSAIGFRQGSGTQFSSVLYGTTGNALFQSIGAIPADNLAGLQLNHSIPASSAIARGAYMTSTLTAAANGDTKVGLDIAPNFVDGAFTGQNNLALRATGNIQVLGDIIPEANNTRTIGSGSFNYLRVNTGSVGTASGAFSIDKAVGSGFYVRNGGASTTIGGAFASTGNWFLQPAGAITTDTGEKLQVTGATKLDGAVSVTGLTTHTGGFRFAATSSSAGTLAITNAMTTIRFTGTTATYTLPTLTGNSGLYLMIINAGSGAIVLNSNAGANDIYDSGTNVNTITIDAGTSVRIVHDSVKYSTL